MWSGGTGSGTPQKHPCLSRPAALLTRLLRFQVEDLFLTFAKKASAFNSWFENAEEDLTDPVRCNSLEEIRALREAHDAFRSSLSSAQADFSQLAELDRQIKSFRVASNPYTWFTMEALEETWRNLQKIIKVLPPPSRAVAEAQGAGGRGFTSRSLRGCQPAAHTKPSVSPFPHLLLEVVGGPVRKSQGPECSELPASPPLRVEVLTPHSLPP